MIVLEFFDPNTWMFNLGISLNRYEQHDGEYQWILKEFVIGLLVLNIKFLVRRNITKMGA